MSKDFIPRKIAEFTEYIGNAYRKAQANITTIYGLPPTALDSVTPAYNRYIAAEAVASNPDTATAGTRRERDTARADLEAKWRTFINAGIRYNELVPVADLEVFGIKAHDDVRTTVGTPTATGLVSVRRTGAFRFEVRVLDAATGKPKHPEHASGSYLYLAVTDIDHTPEHAGEFHKLDFSSTSHHTVTFRMEQIGKMAHIYACYSNVHGKEGPAGPTESFVVS